MATKKKTEVKEEKFTVLVDFLDLEDKSYKYSVGDEYPRKGIKPTKKRIDELKSNKNKLKKPLIK